MTSPQIKAILILDNTDGSRVHAKYFDKNFKENKTQIDFETNLFAKTRGTFARSEADVVMLESSVCVFRSGIDVAFFVCGALDENELILVNVLDTLHDALNGILKSHLDKRTLLDNLDLVLLSTDEVVDGGLILETDPVAVSNRVLMKGATPSADTPVAELTIAQASQNARDQFAKWFRG